MKKRHLITIGMILLICLIYGCGKEGKPDPSETITTYIQAWEKQDYPSMYQMLSSPAKEAVTKDAFIDRIEKIFTDLEIDAINITATPENTVEEAFESGEAPFSLQIEMGSLAGPIQFSRKMLLTLRDVAEDEEPKWEINWNEGFILPGLEAGGKIIIDREKPRRGEIIDRNKMPLALNDVAYEIGVVPNQMNNETAEIKQIAQLLHMTTDTIEKKLNAAWVQPDFFVPLNIVPISAESILAQLENIPSVVKKETVGRTYPLGAAAAHLTGYIGPITAEELEQYPEGTYKENDLIGKTGLEKMFEDRLHGTEGVKIIVIQKSDTGSEEKEIIAEQPVKHGERVQISIDVNIQEKIYNTYDGYAGTTAAIDPHTGEILALVNSPSFDPNEFTYGITQNRWDHLMNDPEKPLINRAGSTYAPGSSLKPITAAVGLQNGAINHKDGIKIKGLTWGKKEWGDVKVTRVSTTEKPVTLEKALIKSDNIYFARKAVEMGSADFIKGMKSFGFTEKLPVSLPIEASQISNDGKLDEILLANTGYGQGEIEVSALHLALAYTAFLNEGNMIKPSFLIDDPKGDIWKKGLIHEQDAKKMKNYLRKVVAEGTANHAKDKDLAIAGKTGTAELKITKDMDGHQNGWFVGYPAKEEDILIAMMIEKVEHVGASSFVAGKVKDVLKEIKK